MARDLDFRGEPERFGRAPVGNGAGRGYSPRNGLPKTRLPLRRGLPQQENERTLAERNCHLLPGYQCIARNLAKSPAFPLEVGRVGNENMLPVCRRRD